MHLRVMLISLAFICICADISSASGLFRQQFPRKTGHVLETGVDPGQPLFLTPYIEKGDIAEGQKLAFVGQLNGTDIPSYSGFLTVNKTYNSNMFFWYFPSQTKQPNDPVVLWLQGGPGGSSLFGLFVENGPFGVDINLNLFPHKFTWNTKYHMIYIDNPVGTGFSFTKDDRGYATTESNVAENLYRALDQFFTLFPDLDGNPFYLTGESYAGKYIPALAYRIHQDTPRRFTLRGVAIGDGFSDPQVMIGAYSDFMFQTGMLDENQRDYFQNQSDIAVQLIKQQKWLEAANMWSGVMTYFAQSAGAIDMYNYLRSKSPANFAYYNSLLALPEVRSSIHVGSLPYQDGGKVELFLASDIMQSVKPQLAVVMNYYKVLIYSGQLDVIVAAPLTEAMLQTVPWKYLKEYQRVKRTVWKVNPTDVEVAGYVRRVHDFYQVIVRGGGHILPYDQPERSWDMIDRFISERPFQ